jgi:hypothetical protein
MDFSQIDRSAILAAVTVTLVTSSDTSMRETVTFCLG